jgi:hypothetical protein
MTQDEMIELAKQAGWQYAHGDSGFEPLWEFAKLVAEKEREACAVDADWCIQNHLEQHISERILARGQS